MTEQEIERLIEPTAERRRCDMEHVRARADHDNGDLTQWCARRRRRDQASRLAVAAAMVVLVAAGSNAVDARPLPYGHITLDGDITRNHTCETIDRMLNLI